VAAFLLQNAARNYYKTINFFIAKRVVFITKTLQVLQNMSIITKCGITVFC